MSSPTRQAPNLSLQNVRRRSMRKPATALSIILEAAFIVILLTATSISQAISKQLGGVAVRPEAYQHWIIVIIIFVWGVGIVSPVVISTVERTKEVGIMKSLGATNTAIIKMLLIEPALIGLLGGVGGALIGWLITVAIYSLQVSFSVILMVPLQIHLFNLAFTVIATLLLSVIAAVFPAYRAVKLGILEDLRSET